MIATLFAVLLAANAAAETPEAAVRRVVVRVEILVAQEAGKDAREIAALDRRAEELYSVLAPLGWRAAAPLGAEAQNKKRSPKTRLFCVFYLSKLRDPAAFLPLTQVFSDSEETVDTRLAAAQALGALDAPVDATRRSFCSVIEQPALPRPLLDQSLIVLSRVGCLDGAALERATRLGGPRPGDKDLPAVTRALAALGRSRGPATLRSLLKTLAYFPPESTPKAAAVAALGERANDLSGPLAAEALPAVRDALRSETNSPASMLILLRVADGLGPAADGLFPPLAAHPDAEVLVVAAEALARRKAVKSLPTLQKIAADALKDPRFSPKPGRPDPTALLTRLENAVDSLRRDRANQK